MCDNRCMEAWTFCSVFVLHFIQMSWKIIDDMIHNYCEIWLNWNMAEYNIPEILYLEKVLTYLLLLWNVCFFITWTIDTWFWFILRSTTEIIQNPFAFCGFVVLFSFYKLVKPLNILMSKLKNVLHQEPFYC